MTGSLTVMGRLGFGTAILIARPGARARGRFGVRRRHGHGPLRADRSGRRRDQRDAVGPTIRRVKDGHRLPYRLHYRFRAVSSQIPSVPTRCTSALSDSREVRTIDSQPGRKLSICAWSMSSANVIVSICMLLRPV